MKRWIIFAAVALIAVGCGQRNKRETPTRGHAVILIDETVFPVIGASAQIFEDQYRRASFDLRSLPEQQVEESMYNDSARLVVLARPLTAEEEAWFEERRITPRITPVGFDGIALITSRESRDTILRTETLREMLTGRSETEQVFVFDSPGSSLIRSMQEFAGTDSLVGVYTLNSTIEVMEYIARTPDAIGFVGVNWLYEAGPDKRPYIERVRVMSVGDDENGFLKPTQRDVGTGGYVFTRRIIFVNAQGSAGLGLGFASFLAGDIGQRIVVQSGLVPITFPQRQVRVRHQL